MSEHPSHRLNSYADSDRKRIVYCEVCSREEENLGVECPGTFVPLSRQKLDKTIDSDKEAN